MSHQNLPPPPPLVHKVDLADLGQAGMDLTLKPDAEERGMLAAWANVTAIPVFVAEIGLRRQSTSRFTIKVSLRAEVEQPCVVTLEPVISKVACAFERELIHAQGRARPEGELTLAAGDDETPDPIESLRYDVWAPLLEEFSLAIDPYPRKSGVAFQPPEDTPVSESPFAALAALRKGS